MNISTNISNTAPNPTIWYVKWHFLLDGCIICLFFFILSGFDEGLLFCLYLLIQFFAGAFLGALLDELALNGKLKEGLLHIAGEAFVEVLQLRPCGFITVNQRKQFCNLCYNARLLSERRKRNY